MRKLDVFYTDYLESCGDSRHNRALLFSDLMREYEREFGEHFELFCYVLRNHGGADFYDDLTETIVRIDKQECLDWLSRIRRFSTDQETIDSIDIDIKELLSTNLWCYRSWIYSKQYALPDE